MLPWQKLIRQGDIFYYRKAIGHDLYDRFLVYKYKSKWALAFLTINRSNQDIYFNKDFLNIDLAKDEADKYLVENGFKLLSSKFHSFI